MGRVIGTIIGLAIGIACVVVGIGMINTPRDRSGGPETAMIGALGEAYTILFGWVVLIFGGLVLCGVLGYLYGRRSAPASRDLAPARVEPPAAELPEARVHGRLPGAKHGK
jgi:hypothetical protein